jgi:hypothetical protein
MKTPREILFERHEAAEAKLDRIRRRVVASLSASPEVGLERPCPLLWLERLWQELVLPCRAAWLSVGAAWVLILVLHLANAGMPTPPHRVATRPTGALRAQLKQQWLLRTELLGDSAPESAQTGTGGGPRSSGEPNLETAWGDWESRATTT